MIAWLAASAALAADPVSVLYPLHGPDLSYELVSVHDGSAVLWRDGRSYAVDVSDGKVSEPGPVAKDDYPRWGLLVGPGPWFDRDFQPRVQPIPNPDGSIGSLWAARKGEALVEVDSNGTELGNIVDGWNLDQKERISPDGTYATWVRYLGASERYSIVAAPLHGADDSNTKITDGPGYPMAGPMWTHDGKSLYVTSIDHKTACLVRADTEPFMEIWQLQCVGAQQGASLVLSPSGTTGAFVVHRTPSAAEVWWLDLPAGIVKSKTKLSMQGTRTADLLLDDNGLFVARGPKGKGLVVADLASSLWATYDANDSFEGLAVSAWTAPGQTVAVRRSADAADVVRIDARAIVDAQKR